MAEILQEIKSQVGAQSETNKKATLWNSLI
jgi:hypothetical protein